MKLILRQNYLLLLLLFVTLLKGAVWAASVPLFQAPDEQSHYATIQFYALPERYEPQSNDFPIEKTTVDDLGTQNVSPELKKILDKTDFTKLRFKPDNQMLFAENSRFGIGERELRIQNLPRFIQSFPAWFVNYGPVYYQPMSWIENALSGQSIIERVYFMRLISVFLGTLLVLAAYFVFRELFFSKIEAVMLAGIVSFQPMLTFINSSINVDPLLFLAFAVFILGSVRILRNKIGFWSLAFILGGMILGIKTKPPGYFMLAALFFLFLFYFLIYYRHKIAAISWKKSLLGLIGLIAFFFFALYAIYFILKLYFPNLLKPLLLLPEYLSFEMIYQVSLERSLSYWGSFGWLDTNISRFFVFSLLVFSILAVLGLIKHFRRTFFLPSQPKSENERIFSFQLLYFLFFVCGISVMIHFVNLAYANPGNLADQTASIGTQGRYFFPSIIPRLTLMVLGISFLFKFADRKMIIFLFLAGMIFLNFISLFGYIIPRYYL